MIQFNKEAARSKAVKIATRIKELAIKHSMNRFWTFTFYSELTYCERMDKWNLFVTAIRYYYPKLGYMGCKEKHPDGNGLHLHMLFDEYVDWHDVQGAWEKCGAGKVVRVDLVPTRRIIQYVVKYISKTIEDKEYPRPYMASRKFCIYLSNFLKWAEKLAGLGEVKLIKFILDKFDIGEYNKVSGRKKKEHMAALWKIAMALQL